MANAGRDRTGRFVKGYKPYFSEEHKRKISEAKIGHTFTEEAKNKISQSLLGRKLPKEHANKVKQNLTSTHNQSGKNNLQWKGGRYITKKGYIKVLVSDCFYMLEHRLFMENYLGRKLEQYEIVHHINGNRQDNNIRNLLLLNKLEHDKLHAQTRFN